MMAHMRELLREQDLRRTQILEERAGEKVTDRALPN